MQEKSCNAGKNVMQRSRRSLATATATLFINRKRDNKYNKTIVLLSSYLHILVFPDTYCILRHLPHLLQVYIDTLQNCPTEHFRYAVPQSVCKHPQLSLLETGCKIGELVIRMLLMQFPHISFVYGFVEYMRPHCATGSDCGNYVRAKFCMGKTSLAPDVKLC